MSGMPPDSDQTEGRRLSQPTDIIGTGRHVVKVPTSNFTRTSGLVEDHADPVLFAPNNVTRNERAVRPKDKIETLGDVVGVSNIERRPRNGKVAD
jgi:hypothetical protein